MALLVMPKMPAKFNDRAELPCNVGNFQRSLSFGLIVYYLVFSKALGTSLKSVDELLLW